jgi:uncharacterized protein
MRLSLLDDLLTICRLEPGAELPDWIPGAGFWSITRTPEELSLVCAEGRAPEAAHCENGWRCLKVEGPLDFSLVGILANLAGVLAAAGVSIFAISTFDTDYLLVKSVILSQALSALRSAGHVVNESPGRGDT